jgi:hypothetical protein
MKIRTLICVLVACNLGMSVAQNEPHKPHRTKSKWANQSTFDCQPQAELMTSWTGQAGKADHQDTATFAKNQYMACRAMSADTQPPPACVVSFENGGKYTIPSHYAVEGPDRGDVITLDCQGTSPTCCQVQLIGGEAKAGKKP